MNSQALQVWAAEKAMGAAWGQISEACDSLGLDGTQTRLEWQGTALVLCRKIEPECELRNLGSCDQRVWKAKLREEVRGKGWRSWPG